MCCFVRCQIVLSLLNIPSHKLHVTFTLANLKKYVPRGHPQFICRFDKCQLAKKLHKGCLITFSPSTNVGSSSIYTQSTFKTLRNTVL